MIYKISITQDDIDQGMIRDASECPIARRLNKMFPGTSWLTVTPDSVRLSYDLPDGVAVYRASFSRSATRFVHAFDKGMRDVQPFNFMLNLERVNA